MSTDTRLREAREIAKQLQRRTQEPVYLYKHPAGGYTIRPAARGRLDYELLEIFGAPS